MRCDEHWTVDLLPHIYQVMSATRTPRHRVAAGQRAGGEFTTAPRAESTVTLERPDRGVAPTTYAQLQQRVQAQLEAQERRQAQRAPQGPDERALAAQVDERLWAIDVAYGF